MTSNTGLMESLKRPIGILSRNPVELSCLTGPAPFILRPFAGLYNPFSHGCSILCNHPADAEIKDVVKRAKDSLISESKSEILVEEMANIRSSMQLAIKQTEVESTVDFVPEELFKRYTDTDSRPLTPAPTLASAVSRGSLRRRCLTPDQPPAPRQTLVLDLRRSHSQETLCWHGCHTSELSSGIGISSVGASLSITAAHSPTKSNDDIINQIPPLVSPVTLSRRSPYLRGNLSDRGQRTIQKSQLRVLQAKNLPPKTEKAPKETIEEICRPEITTPGDCEDDDGEGGAGVGEIRRRGRRRKGRNRLMSAALIATVQNDPETQIAGIGSESHNASSRGSLAQQDEMEADILNALADGISNMLVKDSFLEPDILKHLQREVDSQAIELEFDPKRRCVLEEALRTRPEKVFGKEMQALMKEFQLPPVSLDKWLHLPRVFSRRNAIFSLPIDRRELQNLLPMQYISEYIKVSSSKKLLYQTVLQKFHPDSFYMSLETIKDALRVMMGETLNEKGADEFKSLLEWHLLTLKELKNMAAKSVLDSEETNREVAIVKKLPNTEKESLFAEYDIVPEIKEEKESEEPGIHFRTWCGLCALCERLNAPLPSLKIDPPHEVEVADFDTLDGKLASQQINENVSYILLRIQKTHSENVTTK